MNKGKNQHVPLYHYEMYCYIIIWASGIIYAVYNVLAISSGKHCMNYFYSCFCLVHINFKKN